MISVLIPTKNEEHNLPGCLESLAWCDDIHVYDCRSEDRTTDIARNANAKITYPPPGLDSGMFGGNEAAHKNWAIRNIPFKYSWVLHVDADERVTPELVESMCEAVRLSPDVAAFEIQRRDFLFGSWLGHVQATPFYLRLFQPGRMRYERLINPVSVVNGEIRRIRGFLDHFPFNKGLAYWLERHNLYSTLEAKQLVREQATNLKFATIKEIFAADLGQRRACQKRLFYRLPFRPLVKFGFLYFAKRGFLDGRAGLAYATLQAFYEYMIVLKARELRPDDIRVPGPCQTAQEL
jgi:glycosyltransferase involved in cell wall biosynthesis